MFFKFDRNLMIKQVQGKHICKILRTNKKDREKRERKRERDIEGGEERTNESRPLPMVSINGEEQCSAFILQHYSEQ